MIQKHLPITWIPAFAGMTIALSQDVLACSVCFGDPNSLQSKALGASVFFLLGTVGLVLAGIGYTIFACMRRAKKLDALHSQPS